MDRQPFYQQQYVAVLEDLLTCGAPVYTWHYAADGQLVKTTCPDLVMETIFEHTGCKEYMLAHGRDNGAPLILGAELGLVWCTAFEREEGRLRGMVVLGPVFNTDKACWTAAPFRS